MCMVILTEKCDLAAKYGISEDEFLKQYVRRLKGLGEDTDLNHLPYVELINDVRVPDEDYEKISDEIVFENI